jgi:hypothetical protein
MKLGSGGARREHQRPLDPSEGRLWTVESRGGNAAADKKARMVGSNFQGYIESCDSIGIAV